MLYLEWRAKHRPAENDQYLDEYQLKVVLEVSIEMLVMVNEDNVTRWIDYVVYDKIFFERIGSIGNEFGSNSDINIGAKKSGDFGHVFQSFDEVNELSKRLKEMGEFNVVAIDSGVENDTRNSQVFAHEFRGGFRATLRDLESLRVYGELEEVKSFAAFTNLESFATQLAAQEAGEEGEPDLRIEC
ncbi:hypothetical protein ZIOFF_014440 [Zingiber officinale]|uniref:Uncharacterized protein n=1 Tax=Zingiber officinale TaxID=94328 RepID=A0A8J5HD07_ZINOF|nr:hypothetical protein ZIOFF_014440 [Zingiber officinale]